MGTLPKIESIRAVSVLKGVRLREAENAAATRAHNSRCDRNWAHCQNPQAGCFGTTLAGAQAEKLPHRLGDSGS